MTFSRTIDPASCTASALSLKVDGGPNLIGGAVTITRLSDTTYRIGGLAGLTVAQGHYSLAVDASVVRDLDGLAGVGSASASWLTDTVVPTSGLSLSISPSHLITATVTAADAGPAASGMASDAGYVTSDGNPFPTAPYVTLSPSGLTFTYQGQPGHDYYFRAVATDAAGNVEAKSTLDAGIDSPGAPPVTSVL